MIAAAVIFGITYLIIASGKISHVVIVLLGASLMVLIGVITSEEAFSHIDLSVILLLAGMMVLADIIARTGAFDWAAIQGVRLVRGHGFPVLVLLSLITAVASAFLDNVTTVVIMVPITISLTRSLDLPLFPFLISEIFASNIGGSATIVGDPPNIIVSSAGDIGFVEFLVNIVPVSAASMALLMILLFIWFRNDVKASDEKRQEVLKMSPSDAIRDRDLLWKSVGVFALTTVGFLMHGLLDVSPAFIALAGAGLLLLISGLEPRDVLRGVEWSTLTFFGGLFVMVGALVETGITDQIQRWMVEFAGGSERNLSFILVWFGGGVSSIVDNIPYTATIAPVVKQLAEQSSDEKISPLWWALTLGADLGGNFTTVGASANVVVLGMARAAGHSIGFMQFLKYGAVISIATLAISAGYLWLRFYY